MKKIININLSGRVIPIEDSAYDKLKSYVDSLRRYFSSEEGRDEIINDIESRIAELMSDKVNKGATAVTDEDIEEIITSMGRVEDLAEAEAAEAGTTTSGTSTSGFSATIATPGLKTEEGKFFRDSNDKILGGVCSGIAHKLSIDPAIIRVLFVIFLFAAGVSALMYILFWIVLPARPLEHHTGKRFYRNPDDKVIAGVAGGLAAYFNSHAWTIRLILVAPLILNIIFGVFNGIFGSYDRDIFPNFFVVPFTSTFSLAYIILWIVLPEARSPFQKMEMRGEKVDVNRIKQNVQEGMSEVKTRMQSFGEEVKESAQNLGSRVKDFSNTRGKEFASEFSQTATPAARGAVHVIGVLFKAFFIFVAGCIALSLFALLMVIIFGGVAWWPVNNFLWSSGWQKTLAFMTVIFFIAVPVVAFITWLVRRIMNVRSKNNSLSWTFGSLWLIGWFAAIFFGISIGKDLKSYERVESEVPMTNITADTLLNVKVSEPVIRYTGESWMFSSDEIGWDLTPDVMRLNNVKIRVRKSDDSLYHTAIYKYSAGSSIVDARRRAEGTAFATYAQDSTLYIGSGVSIPKNIKFRGQGVIVEISVPAGKWIRFDETVEEAFDGGVIRRVHSDDRRDYRSRGRNDWDEDLYFDYEVNKSYQMSADGKLIDPTIPVKKDENRDDEPTLRDEIRVNEDSLQRVYREQQRVFDSIQREMQKTNRKLEREGVEIKVEVKDREGSTSATSMPYLRILI